MEVNLYLETYLTFDHILENLQIDTVLKIFFKWKPIYAKPNITPQAN